MSKRKKKNAVTLISLLLALAVLIIFYYWYSNKDNKSQEPKKVDKVDTITVTKIDTTKLNTLHVTNKDTDMTLILEDKLWKSKENSKLPINQNKINDMLILLAKITATRKIDVTSDKLSDYGLSEPYIKIETIENDGKTQKINIGSEASTGDGYYATVNGEDKVYLLSADYGTKFDYNSTDITSVETAPTIDSKNINHVSIDNREGQDFELLLEQGNKLDYTGTGMYSWMILKPYKEGYTADSTKITEFLAKYTNFNYLSCVDYEGKDLSKYGLDNPKASIYVGYVENTTKKLDKPEKDPTTGKKVTEKIFSTNKELKVYIGNKEASGNYYAKVEGSNSIYTLNADTVDTMLEVNVFDLLNKFVILPNIETVNSIDITVDGKPYTMEIKRSQTKDQNGKALATYYYNGKSVDEKMFKTVYQNMVSATYDSESKKEVSIDGKEPFMTITYHLNNNNSVVTSYYPYNDSFYGVKFSDKVRFFADKRKIDAIAKAVKEFKGIEYK